MTAEPTTLVGTLARDPELRYTPDGNAVASLTVVVDSPDRTGKSTHHTVTCWRDLAERAALSLQQGDRVIVICSPANSGWTDQDGADHTEEILIARAIGPDLRYTAAIPLQPPRRTVVEDEEGDEDAMGDTR